MMWSAAFRITTTFSTKSECQWRPSTLKAYHFLNWNLQVKSTVREEVVSERTPTTPLPCDSLTKSINKDPRPKSPIPTDSTGSVPMSSNPAAPPIKFRLGLLAVQCIHQTSQ
ncbi:hypothetical protein OS493_027363 [Desmophyllum pertusum]|uniref:Uncharacterized protein n=1 Tax=Desmophyllum pertusum TaxID=174260 RepID=A0A9X0CRW5_9CNID|nr:hypothetical protein OS493_027363 [Desmophyllum pertusum]